MLWSRAKWFGLSFMLSLAVAVVMTFLFPTEG